MPSANRLIYKKAKTARSEMNLWRKGKGAALILAGFWLGMAPFTIHASPGIPELEKQVDSMIAEMVKPDQPGMVVAIIKKGEVLLNKGFGLADLEHGIADTPQTVFNVGSIAKQFTALAITILEQQGRLSAADDIRKLIPELPDFGQRITIYHLLHHLSGLRDDIHLWILSGHGFEDAAEQRDLLSMTLRQTKLQFIPGARFSYSNTNYSLLALIVSRATGQPFGKWMDENIFQPLGMRSTTVPENSRAIIPNLACCYQTKIGGGFWKAPLNWAYPGPSNLFSTSEDLVKWLVNFETKTLGGDRGWRAMLTPGTLVNGEQTGYARGIRVDDNFSGHKAMRHGGTAGGFNSEIVYFPEEQLGIIVLANWDTNATSLGQRIMRILFPDDPKAAAGTGQNQTEKIPAIPHAAKKLGPGLLDRITGFYLYKQVNYWFVREIVRENDRLFYVRSAQDRTELLPLSETEFNLAGSNIIIVFDELKDKRYMLLTFDARGDRPSRAQRIEPFRPSHRELEAYEGFYFAPELGALHHFAAEGNDLFNASLRFQKGIPLQPIVKDQFTFDNGEGQICFQRDQTGVIAGYSLNFPRVGEILFQKLLE